FGAGQVIYYLFTKSQTAEKTHALLEPFLQKTNYQQFNDALVNLIARYKHALGFGFKRFEKLTAEVLSYQTTIPFKSLSAFMLAGYFSPNVIYKKKEEKIITE